MKAELTLTVPESKRLIGRAVKEHRAVKQALKEGIVVIALGSTNAFVLEEIAGKSIEKERYIAGLIDESGTCVVPKENRLREVVLEKGRRIEEDTESVVRRMGSKDVFIKGANALDFEGIAGVMMASLTGGTIAKVLGILKARGTKIIIPVGLEKLIPSSISEISKITGIYGVDYANGIPAGIMPVSGEIITEIEAFDILTGVNAYVIASGGIGNAPGSKTFLVEGNERSVKKAIGIVNRLKGEKGTPSLRGNCRKCSYNYCPMNKKDI